MSSPVVRELPTIMLAPSQLMSRMQAYTVKFISGAFQERIFSAERKVL